MRLFASFWFFFRFVSDFQLLCGFCLLIIWWRASFFLKRLICLISSHSFSAFLIGSLAFGLNLVFFSFKLFMVRIFIEKEKECQLAEMLDQFWIKWTLGSDFFRVKCFESFSSIELMYIRTFDQVLDENSQHCFFLVQRRNRKGSIWEVGIAEDVFNWRTLSRFNYETASDQLSCLRW